MLVVQEEANWSPVIYTDADWAPTSCRPLVIDPVGYLVADWN